MLSCGNGWPALSYLIRRIKTLPPLCGSRLQVGALDETVGCASTCSQPAHASAKHQYLYPSHLSSTASAGEVHSKHPHRTSTGKQNLSVPVAATEAEALGQTTLMPEQQAQQQQQRRRQAQQQAQQAQRADGERGGRSSGAGAEDSPYPATAELAETVLQQRLSKAIQDLEAAADGDQRLRALLWLASVGHGGALLQVGQQKLVFLMPSHSLCRAHSILPGCRLHPCNSTQPMFCCTTYKTAGDCPAVGLAP